jgi:PAS domain S-box-containing protein
MAAWEFRQASRRVDLGPAIARSLSWVGASFVAQALGGLVLIVALMRGRVDSGSKYASNASFALSYLGFILSLARLPPTRHAGTRRLRILIDGTLFIAGIGVPFVLLTIDPVWAKMNSATFLWILVLPVLAFLGLVTASWAIETRLVSPSRRAFQYLAAGLGVMWLADVVLSIDRAYSIIPGGTVQLVNAANAVSFALCLYSAHLYRTDPVTRLPDKPLVAFSPLPIITIVVEVGFLILLVYMGPSDVHVLTRLLLCLCGVLLLLLARETFLIQESLRLQAAEARLEEKARFEEMVRYSSDVIVVVDERLRVTFASPTAGSVLGIPAQTLMGGEILSFVHPQDRASAEAFLNGLILDPSLTSTVRWRLAGQGGDYRELESSGSNRLAEPSIRGLVLNSRDVTERNALEDRLHRARKMEAIGRLAGGVAHDFNNLLTIIIANAELALAEMRPEDRSRHDIEEIRSAATRGATLTGRMLAFSRTERIRPKAVFIRDVVDESRALLARAAGDAVRLDLGVSPESGWVKVDPDEFVHALINLCANARDAMPKGGTLTISIHPETPEPHGLRVYLDAPPGSYVVVEVTDTGLGMDEATLARAFEPFFTTKDRSRGTGLGLASVYGMVKSAGGGISLSSSIGAGTTIRLRLPAVAEGADAKRPSNTGPAQERATATVLLVEDDAAVREAILRTLRSSGFTVQPAGSFEEALAAFRSHGGAFDLLLADVILPGRSGPETARELRLIRPDLRVLFISGYTDRHLADAAASPAGARLLHKPFTQEQLIANVRSALSGDPAPGA